MKSKVFLLSLLTVLFAACKNDSANTKSTSDKVVTVSATDVTGSSALLTGQVGIEIADYKSMKFGMLISDKESDVSSYEGKKLAGDKLIGQAFSLTAKGLSAETKYYYRAYLILNDMQYEYGVIKSFVTEKGGTESVHAYVDLGLSVKWATCNVGATNPEDYGDYFAWGEKEPYYSSLSPLTWKTGKTSGYAEDWSSYFDAKFDEGAFAGFNKYYKEEGGKTVLESTEDAASVNWGGGWRMPTEAEFTELLDNCDNSWTTQNGVNGCLFTSTKEGYTDKSIFLPAAGYFYGTSPINAGSYGNYWSSSLYTSYSSYGRSLDFNSGLVGMNINCRYYGQAVRPVCQ